VSDIAPNTYKGDNDCLLAFVNDTRLQQPVQPADPTAPLPPPAPPPQTQGLSESLMLLTKGGWWDHSDGNRITTTAGDKIEIIQGNYKIVVLGRQALPTTIPDPTKDLQGYQNAIGPLASSSDIIDSSGGFTVQSNANPDGFIKSVEYTQDLNGTWTQYENGGVGTLCESFYGRQAEMFCGPVQESWTGTPPSDFTTSDFYQKITTQSPLSKVSSQISQFDPDISEYTWANSITSYTGSEGKTIPSITEHTFADNIKGYTGSATKPVQTITETTFAGAITEVTTAAAKTEQTNVAAAIVEQTNAATITEETNVGVKTEVTVAGAAVEVFVGLAHIELELSAKLEAFLGAKAEFRIGPAFELNIPEAKEVNWPEKTTTTGANTQTALTTTTTTAGTNTNTATVQNVVGATVNIGTAPSPPPLPTTPSPPARPPPPIPSG
jgi:hypothetical protein